jgi:hypothetical protein
VKYWDSSAIVPLLVTEPASERVRKIHAADAATVTWWATPVECASAFARLEREGGMSQASFADALARLRRAAATWAETSPSMAVREQAIRLVRIHHLRAADATQLAAAIIAADYQPSSLEFVTLDTRQAEAAEKEGFRVIT